MLEALGLFVAPPDEAARAWQDTSFGRKEGEPFAFQPLVAGPAAALVLLVGSLTAGYEGAALTVLLSLALLVPAALRRPGLLVFVVLAALYLPLLGVPGLWDPWETHYGEVAREIISRDDWISLWWAQENWFWSKPIAIFWSEAFFLSALNVDCQPGRQSPASRVGHPPPRRAPQHGAVMCVYGTDQAHLLTPAPAMLAPSRWRSTAPHFFFLAHQAITDMYLVANVMMALCMLMLAFAAEPDALSKTVGVVRVGKPRPRLAPRARRRARHLAAAAGALPASAATSTSSPTRGFRWHADQFLFGSAGNSGVPGNARCATTSPT